MSTAEARSARSRRNHDHFMADSWFRAPEAPRSSEIIA